MANYSTQGRSDQRNKNRYKDTKEAQQEWLKCGDLLLKNKQDLGHEGSDWNAFLALGPEALPTDPAQKQMILDLQQQYKEHAAKQEMLWAEDNVVEEFNQKHAIMHTDQTSILTEKTNVLGNRDFSVESKESFKMLYENQLVLCGDGLWRPKGKIWLEHPNRRTYHGVTFNPKVTGHVGNLFNLWMGFKRAALKGNCALFWEHVASNICSKNQELYRFVRKWLAYIVQYPHKLHTAIVLCGSQGVGKNKFVDTIGELFGQHYMALSSMHELVANFNYHQKYAILLHANEALWGGHKKDIGTVKAMITDPTYLLEGKGKDRILMPNFRHVIISSNEMWPVHLDADCRRFLVLQVSDARKEDRAYFKAIQTELDNGGYEALFRTLTF